MVMDGGDKSFLKILFIENNLNFLIIFVWKNNLFLNDFFLSFSGFDITYTVQYKLKDDITLPEIVNY